MPAAAPTPWAGAGGSSLQGCLGEKCRTMRDQAPGLGARISLSLPWTVVSKLGRSVPMSLTPGSHTPANTHQPGGRTDPCPVPERGLLLRSTQGPRGSRGASTRLTPTPRSRAEGAGRRLEAEPPGRLRGSRGSPRGWVGALLKGFGTIRRKRKEGAGGGQEVKGTLVLLNRGFVVTNWPQTLVSGNSRASLGPPHPSPSPRPTSPHS